MVIPTQEITITPEIEVLDAVELPTRTYHLDLKKVVVKVSLMVKKQWNKRFLKL